jgi:NADH:ubiquinone oxidoreductase subunit 6 (subunit J)
MNLVGNVYFIVMAALSVAGAIVTIASRSPIRSAIGLLATIVGIAGLFLKLSAEFMAAIQLIVYAGAVVVLFVFVIMLLGPDAGAPSTGLPRARLSRALGAALVAALFAGAAFWTFSARPLVTLFAVVGAIAVARSAHNERRQRPTLDQGPTRRLFHGPLHPRDARHPLQKERA